MKILCMPNGHAIAHVSRLLETAKILRRRGHEITFAGGGRYLGIAGDNQFDVQELPYCAAQDIDRAVAERRYDLFFSRIDDWIDADTQLINSLRPDIVFVDNRLSAFTAAELTGVSTVNIVNVHMTRFRKIPYRSVRSIAGNRDWVIFSALDKIENHIEDVVWNLSLKELNRARKRFRLKARSGFAHEEGDLILFPDIPEFNPVQTMPDNARYVGPITWRNDLPKPEYLSRLDPERKTIYLTVGSYGSTDILNALIKSGTDDLQVVVSTGLDNFNYEEPPPWVYVSKYVNADLVLPYCDLLVSHGGNGTIYQALSNGVPVFGIANHDEQYYNLKRVIAIGAGRGMHWSQLSSLRETDLVDKIRACVEDPNLRQRARNLGNIIAEYGGPETAANCIEDFVSRG